MTAPHHFRDEMVDGAFAYLRHDHTFTALGPDRTLMVDDFHFASPLGPLGWLVDKVFLERYLRNFLAQRNLALLEYCTA